MSAGDFLRGGQLLVHIVAEVAHEGEEPLVNQASVYTICLQVPVRNESAQRGFIHPNDLWLSEFLLGPT